MSGTQQKMLEDKISYIIESLNQLALTENVPVEMLQFKLPKFPSPDLMPYTPFINHKLKITKNYANLLKEHAHSIQDSGIEIISPKAKDKVDFAMDQLIVPSITNLLKETSQLIKENISPESHLQDFRENLTIQIIDARNLMDIYKEFVELKTKNQTNNLPYEQLEQICQNLRKLLNLHYLFLLLDIGSLASYSTLLHLTYLRVYLSYLSKEYIFEGQSLLLPISTQVLLHIQTLSQNKLQANQLQQRISLLNRMKMAFGDLISVAFKKEDGPEYNNISQWIDIVMQLCQMNDVDGVQQIKPLCINLPKLPEFPQLADDLWHLIEMPPLNDQERQAVEHMQSIYLAEFNGEDINSNITDIDLFRTYAMTKDYTILLRQAKDYGFAVVDDDYELGQYGDSYANRFIEHHWRISINQIDDFAKSLYNTLPPPSSETEHLHKLFSLVRNGGMTLENVILFGKTALKLRSLFTKPAEFTLYYRKLHIFASFLEHHDTLAELIGKLADSELIAFSFTRTINYLRFVKYATSLLLMLNSCSVFPASVSPMLFTQSLSLPSYAQTIKVTMKLTNEACDKLQHFIQCVENVFSQGLINYDVLFAKAKLFLKTFASQNTAPEFVNNLQNQFHDIEEIAPTQNVINLHNAVYDILKTVEQSEYKNDDYIKNFLNIVNVIMSITQLHSIIEPANNFIENDGLNYIKFSSPYELSNIATESHKGAPKYHAFTIPRPRITLPSTTLKLEQQNQILEIFQLLQKEREDLTPEFIEHQELNEERDKQISLLAEIFEQRRNHIDSLNALKEGIKPFANQALGEGSDAEQDAFSSPDSADTRLRSKRNETTENMTMEFKKRTLLADVFSEQIEITNSILKKRSAELAGEKEIECPLLDELKKNKKEVQDNAEQNKPEPQASNIGLNPDTIDKQLLPILQKCDIKIGEK